MPADIDRLFRFFPGEKMLQCPGNGESWDEVRKGQDLFDEVEHTAKCALPAAESAEEDQS